MVGDVKQSIYKFRLARPELFMEKYDKYSIKDSLYQRVNLHQNFRSREVVLNCVNLIFEQIMTKRLGNIEYDKEAALHPGAIYPEGEENISDSTELLLISGKSLTHKENFIEDMTEEEESYTEKELEAKVIAKKIKKITNSKTGILISDNGKLRLAEYGDIVVLLRTMSEWAEVFTDVFMEEGIPAYSDTRSGYFETLEVTTILNMLRVIDNPRQDIPLAAVLVSPIVRLNDEEMAIIKIADKEGNFYDSILAFLEKEPLEIGELENNGEEKQKQIKQKLEKFLSLLEEFRYMVTYMPIHELLEQVLERTGYFYYITAMSVGERRSANLKMLLQKAVDFEVTSYRGLFQFIRYIEKLHKYEIDFGEAGAGNENDEAVRIMSIHKSKGLEFPIVFVAGMGKPFNTMDLKSRLVFHPDLGLGPDYVNYRLRIKAPTLIKKVLQKQLGLENLAEELRILYVALTRAKEKLIITGRVKDIDRQLPKWNDTLSYQKLSNAGCYLDYIVPALIAHQAFIPILKQFGMESHVEKFDYHYSAKLKVEIEDITGVIEKQIGEVIGQQIKKEELLSWDTGVIYDREISEKLEHILNYQYSYEQETELHAKLTVSELKKEAQIDLEKQEIDLGVQLIEYQEEVYIPEFMKEETPISGMNRGTIYHKILENINFENAKTKKGIKEELIYLQEKGILEKQDIQRVAIEKILNFTKSSLAERMKEAQQRKKLYKEKPFVMGIPANQIRKEYESDELILVQGVIDVYFEENDELVLVDYKTDWIPQNGQQLLVERYKTQLDYYEKALTRATRKKVKEKYIYSFALNCEIKI